MDLNEFFKNLWIFIHSKGHEGYQEQINWLFPIVLITAGCQGFLIPDSLAYKVLDVIANMMLFMIIYLLICSLTAHRKK